MPIHNRETALKDHEAISRLWIRGLITESERDRADTRLRKALREHGVIKEDSK